MDKKRLIIEVTDEIHREAKSRAYAEGKTLKQKIIELIEEWLEY